MEAGLAANPRMEESNSGFKSFAFDTHVPAYVGSGVLNLGMYEKLLILNTPSYEDVIYDKDGRRQMMDVMKLQMKKWDADLEGPVPQ